MCKKLVYFQGELVVVGILNILFRNRLVVTIILMNSFSRKFQIPRFVAIFKCK